MTEIDLRRTPWFYGYPTAPLLLDREIYSLLCIFGASQTLDERRASRSETNLYEHSIKEFEFAEISRLLLTIAVVVRNALDAKPGNFDDPDVYPWLERSVGTLVPDLAKQEVEPLDLRQSLHKVIHATSINLDRSTGKNIYDGHLLPTVHLYGTKPQGKKRERQWKASLEVYSWAEAISSLAI
jgi:hypothetical protein